MIKSKIEWDSNNGQKIISDRKSTTLLKIDNLCTFDFGSTCEKNGITNADRTVFCYIKYSD